MQYTYTIIGVARDRRRPFSRVRGRDGRKEEEGRPKPIPLAVVLSIQEWSERSQRTDPEFLL